MHSVWALAAVIAITRRRWLRLRPRGIAEIAPTAGPGVPPGAGAMLIAGGMAMYCAEVVGASSAQAILGRNDSTTGIVDHDLWWTGAVMAGSYVGAIAALIFVVILIPEARRLAGLPRTLRDAGRSALRGIAGFAVIYPIAWAMGWAMAILARWIKDPQGMDPMAHQTLREIADAPADLTWWAVIALVVIGAPIFEEIIYRGFLQPGAALLTGRPWAAVIGTSVLFVLMHAGAVSWHALPVLFVLSIGLGIARIRTGSVVAPIVIHALFNLANVALIGVGL